MNNLKRVPTSRMMKRLGAACAITAVIAVGELLGGILSNSLALLGDAGHMFTDVLAITLSLVAFRLASRPTTPGKTFGLLRVEILAALANGAILFFVAVFLIYEGIGRLSDPPDVDANIMLPVAGIGLIANIAGAFLLKDQAATNLNIKGAFYHMLSDAASSMAVIMGGIIIIATGATIADPIVSFIVAALILRGSWYLLSQSVNILVEAAPPHIDMEELHKDIRRFQEITDIHEVHIWTITSGIYAMSGHLLVGDQSIGDCASIIERVNEFLREKYGIQHATWQLECEPCQDVMSCRLNGLHE